MKKILFIITMFIVVIFITLLIKDFNKNNELKNSVIKIDNQKWSKKYPEIFNNVGYGKLIESKNILDNYTNSPESLQILRGKITNVFGIRDDILEYILRLNLNYKSKYSIIKMTQIDTYIYFGAKTQQEVLKFDKFSNISLRCLSISNKDWLKISQKIDSMMRDTKERNKRMWWVDNHYFAYQALGTRLREVEEDEICEKGNY